MGTGATPRARSLGGPQCPVPAEPVLAIEDLIERGRLGEVSRGGSPSRTGHRGPRFALQRSQSATSQPQSSGRSVARIHAASVLPWRCASFHRSNASARPGPSTGPRIYSSTMISIVLWWPEMLMAVVRMTCYSRPRIRFPLPCVVRRDGLKPTCTTPACAWWRLAPGVRNWLRWRIIWPTVWRTFARARSDSATKSSRRTCTKGCIPFFGRPIRPC